MFWQVSVEGSELTVCSGRVGTGGQTKVRPLASAEEAEKEAARLVRFVEDGDEGYVEVPAVGAERT